MSSVDSPLFSVIIPVYNRVVELARAIDSVFAQSLQDFEVLVVDDGSDDERAAAIASLVHGYGQPRLRLIRYSPNRNGAYARNRGIEAACGRYLCFLDSDDEWLAGKLASVSRMIKAQPGARLCYHQYRNQGGGQGAVALPVRGIAAGQSVAEYSFCQNRGGGIQSSCLTVEAGLAKATLFNEALRGHQDWDFVLRLGAQVSQILFIAEPLTIRHVGEGHGDMVSRSLDYPFSLQFIRDYERYFSWRAQAAYGAYVLTARRLMHGPSATFTRYQLLAWIFYPRHCWQQYRKIRHLHRRCRQLIARCRAQGLMRVGLVGWNDYCRFFLGHYRQQLQVVALIDQCRRGTVDGLPAVRPVAAISPAEWQQLEALVTMTDHHHESMRRDLAPYAQGRPLLAF